ncbi:MAG: hypothetical protein IKA67_04325 [Clostridia bacterium]|nr:hypothetical protein [Clostridia bacterium]
MKKEKRLRDVRVAVTILILLVALATANVVTSGILLKSLAKEVETVSIGKAAEAEALYKKFTRVAFFLSITVNHDDLEDAEELMVELNVAVRGEDAEEVEILKSRLRTALGQLRRLSAVGIDSII